MRPRQVRQQCQRRKRASRLSRNYEAELKPNNPWLIEPRLANRCFRPLSHLSVFNSPDINELWSLSLYYTAIFALRGTIVTILSLVPNRSTARRFVSSLECA